MMIELSFKIDELKKIIDKNKIIGSGFYGTTIVYQDKLLKIDNYIFNKIKHFDLFESKKNIMNYYNSGKTDFANKEQIEYLCSVQKNVHLTKLPEGIISLKEFNNALLGIIIPYHKDYKKLEELPLNDYKRLLLVLKNLLLEVKELENNKIAQEDFAGYGSDGDINCRNYNVMYKDIHPEIIDLSGFFVKVGKDFISSNNMYRDLSNIFIDYLYFYKIKSGVVRGTITSYDENVELYKKLEYGLKKK